MDRTLGSHGIQSAGFASPHDAQGRMFFRAIRRGMKSGRDFEEPDFPRALSQIVLGHVFQRRQQRAPHDGVFVAQRIAQGAAFSRRVGEFRIGLWADESKRHGLIKTQRSQSPGDAMPLLIIRSQRLWISFHRRQCGGNKIVAPQAQHLFSQIFRKRQIMAPGRWHCSKRQMILIHLTTQSAQQHRRIFKRQWLTGDALQQVLRQADGFADHGFLAFGPGSIQGCPSPGLQPRGQQITSYAGH